MVIIELWDGNPRQQVRTLKHYAVGERIAPPATVTEWLMNARDCLILPATNTWYTIHQWHPYKARKYREKRMEVDQRVCIDAQPSMEAVYPAYDRLTALAHAWFWLTHHAHRPPRAIIVTRQNNTHIVTYHLGDVNIESEPSLIESE